MDDKSNVDVTVEHTAALAGQIEQKGHSLDEQQHIECHFRAATQLIAEQLAEELQRRGFAVLRMDESQDGSCWNVELTIYQSVRTTVSEEFTADMEKLAGRFRASYHGWVQGYYHALSGKSGS